MIQWDEILEVVLGFFRAAPPSLPQKGEIHCFRKNCVFLLFNTGAVLSITLPLKPQTLISSYKPRGDSRKRRHSSSLSQSRMCADQLVLYVHVSLSLSVFTKLVLQFC